MHEALGEDKGLARLEGHDLDAELLGPRRLAPVGSGVKIGAREVPVGKLQG